MQMVQIFLTKSERSVHAPPLPSSRTQLRSGAKWFLETFTDADWSGSRGHECVHAFNGLVVFASSGGQKVSFSSSELHALVSGACDGISIKSIIVVLVNEEVHHVCLLDKSSIRQIAQKKGSGKLRHVSGKIELQQKRWK